MRRLRVALVAHSVDDVGLRGSGMERVSAELIRHARDDFDFVVVSSDLPSDLRGMVDWRRVRIPRRPAILRFLVFYVSGGWKLRNVDADIRHSVGAIIPNRVTLATVHYCHAAFRQKIGRRAPRTGSLLRRLNTFVYKALAELVERRAYRPTRTESLAAVSSGLANELREHYPLAEVHVTPNGIDLRRFRSDAQRREDLRMSEEVPDEELVALFVGGDWHRKGLELAIEAIGLAVRRCLPVRLWVVGVGDERRMHLLAADCGAEGALRFFGRRSDVERFYAAADLLLLPSFYETFSLVAHEAAASSLPVVATRVSGVEELVREGGGGILVEPKPSAILDALRQLADSELRRKTLGIAGRTWVQRFTWEASAAATAQVYSRLAERFDDQPISAFEFTSRERGQER